MKIEAYFDKNVIIITDSIQKKKILKYASRKHILLKCKIHTLEEIKKMYVFTYEDKTIVKLMEKEKTIPSIASIYMKYFYYLEKKEYKSEKIKKLVSLFDYLQKENLIKKDPISLKFMKNKKIVLYELQNIEEGDKKLLSSLSVQNEITFLEEDKKDFFHKLYSFQTMEEEVSYLASSIAKLLDKGISINQIKVILLNKDYKSIIKRIFSFYSIPFEIKEGKSLLSYDMTKYFLFLLKEEEDISEIPFLLSENYDLKNPILKEVYDKLVDILNTYDFVSDKNIKWEIMKYVCTKETISSDRYENVVEVKSLYQDSFLEDDFLFLVGASLSYFPVLHKDDDYLSDTEKEELDLSTSLQKNQKEEAKLMKFLSEHKNISISYCLFSSLNEYAKSSFVEKLLENGYLKEERKEKMIYSKEYASYLLSKELDEYVKYNKVSDKLPLLYGNVSNSYKTYKNKYTPLKKEDLLSYLDGKLILSYTSLENFYKCRFRFYMQNILKVKEEKEETIERVFGNIVHEVLEKFFKEEKDTKALIDSVIHSYYENEKCTFKEKFYIEKYKREMEKMLSILKEQKERSSFVETYLEKEFSKDITFHDLKVKLVGKIDKVCTYKEGSVTYVEIVDYKTGNTTFDIHNIYYGLGMQLFLYYLLLKENKDVSFAGVYLQNVVRDILPAKEGKTYDELLYDAYKLDGFTIRNKRIVNALDKEEKNSFIKSMRFKTDGDFYFNAKVLEEDTVLRLTSLVFEKVMEAVKQIYNADFAVEPKSIGFEKEEEQTGCKYCPYRDICFKEDKDTLYLPKQKDLEFLKGDVYE